MYLALQTNLIWTQTKSANDLHVVTESCTFFLRHCATDECIQNTFCMILIQPPSKNSERLVGILSGSWSIYIYIAGSLGVTQLCKTDLLFQTFAVY